MRKLRILLFFIAFSLFSASVTKATDYYVAANGKLVNKGTKKDPLSFDYFEQLKFHPGDTFYVQDGTYANHWAVRISGTANQPVVIKSENWMGADLIGVKEERMGKRIILRIDGQYSQWQGFEVFDQQAENRISNNGEAYFLSDGVQIFGPGNKVVNFVTHDVLIGYSSWSTATESEFYGNIAYNIGWNNAKSVRGNQGHGHGYYIQNKQGLKQYKNLELNIVWGTASEGFHAYTQKGDITYFYFQDNLAFNMIGYNAGAAPGRGYILGGYQPVDHLKFIGNHAVQTNVQIGYGSPFPVISDSVIFIGNYWYNSSINLYYLNVKEFCDNVIVGSNPLFYSLQAGGREEITTSWPLKRNQFYLNDPSEKMRVGLQEMGNGTNYREVSEMKWSENNRLYYQIPPSRSFIYKNKYDPGRLNVYIYNFEGKNSVAIDLENFLKKGDRIQLRDVENLGKIIWEGKYQGKPIDIPMNLTELAPISGNLPAAHARHSGKEFNAFILTFDR